MSLDSLPNWKENELRQQYQQCVGKQSCFLACCCPLNSRVHSKKSRSIQTQQIWKGWSEVPGGGTTDVALAVGNFGSTMWLFRTGIDQKVYVNTLDVSSPFWSGWDEVPGNGVTDTALAAVDNPGDKLYLFAKGLDNKIYVNWFQLGAWSGWSEVPGNGVTDTALAAAPAVNAFTLHLFSKGLDRKVYENVYAFGLKSWSGWREVPGHATTDVALAATSTISDEPRIHLFSKGLDQKIY